MLVIALTKNIWVWYTLLQLLMVATINSSSFIKKVITVDQSSTVAKKVTTTVRTVYLRSHEKISWIYSKYIKSIPLLQNYDKDIIRPLTFSSEFYWKTVFKIQGVVSFRALSSIVIWLCYDIDVKRFNGNSRKRLVIFIEFK